METFTTSLLDSASDVSLLSQPRVLNFKFTTLPVATLGDGGPSEPATNIHPILLLVSMHNIITSSRITLT